VNCSAIKIGWNFIRALFQTDNILREFLSTIDFNLRGVALETGGAWCVYDRRDYSMLFLIAYDWEFVLPRATSMKDPV